MEVMNWWGNMCTHVALAIMSLLPHMNERIHFALYLIVTFVIGALPGIVLYCCLKANDAYREFLMVQAFKQDRLHEMGFRPITPKHKTIRRLHDGT